jgi:hypothetical protein
MSPVIFLVPLMVLVPLIPAFVLFNTLKSSATTTAEEFYGFKVQLGGAFAGYFVLMLLLLYFFRPYLTPPASRVVYQLQGQVVDDKLQGVPVAPGNFALLPEQPMVSTDTNGNFLVYFLVDPNNGNFRNFPKIEVSYHDFLPANLTLDPNDPAASAVEPTELKRDDVNHIIYAPKIKLNRPDQDDVHVSNLQPIQGIAPEYKKIGKVPTLAPPPGYSAATSSITVP